MVGVYLETIALENFTDQVFDWLKVHECEMVKRKMIMVICFLIGFVFFLNKNPKKFIVNTKMKAICSKILSNDFLLAIM